MGFYRECFKMDSGWNTDALEFTTELKDKLNNKNWGLDTTIQIPYNIKYFREI